MKKIKISVSLLLLILVTVLLNAGVVSAEQNSTLNNNQEILYYGSGCPHCAKVESFLDKNNLGKNIVKKEIYHNTQNAEEFNRLCDKKGIKLVDRGVPFLATKNQCLVGDEQIINYFQKKVKSNNQTNQKNNKKSYKRELTIPVLVGAALVDAINPCAFAVLLLLMITLLAAGKRKKALFSGLAFSLAIFLSYFLMGLGLYSVVASFKASEIFMKIIGIVAVIIGLLNLKDYFWYGKGFLMEVPLSWRPKMKKIIGGVTSPLGAFSIGFIISLFLLPCTSGPYIVIIGMLGQKVTHTLAIKLLLLYNLIFVFPMILISIATYWGLNIKKSEEKRSKNLQLLHLVAGIIMILMGIYLLFFM